MKTEYSCIGVETGVNVLILLKFTEQVDLEAMAH